MKNIDFDLVVQNGLMNSSADGYHMFFDKDLACFVVSENDEPPVWCADHDVVMCPYAVAPKAAVWKRFYEIISDDERAQIDSFEGNMSFFNFMRETGIICTYREAERLVIEDIFKAWVVLHGITIDWNNIVVR